MIRIHLYSPTGGSEAEGGSGKGTPATTDRWCRSRWKRQWYVRAVWAPAPGGRRVYRLGGKSSLNELYATKLFVKRARGRGDSWLPWGQFRKTGGNERKKLKTEINKPREITVNSQVGDIYS